MSVVCIIPEKASGLAPFYAELIEFTPASPPPRPQPGPTPPDPNAPRPTHPIMLPGMPGWPTTPPSGGTAPEGTQMVAIAPVPPPADGSPPPAPPAGMPAGTTQISIAWAPGVIGKAWAEPYVSPH